MALFITKHRWWPLRPLLLLCIVVAYVVLPGGISLSQPEPASAYVLEGCHWPSMPVNFFNGGSSGTDYPFAIDTAAAGWTNTPTNVWLIDQYSTSFIVWDQNDGNNGVTGSTEYACFIISNTFYFAHAHINSFYGDSNPYNGKVNTLTHEMGHSIGLDHSGSLCGNPAIMYNSYGSFIVCGIYTPQTDDINGARAIYG